MTPIDAATYAMWTTAIYSSRWATFSEEPAAKDQFPAINMLDPRPDIRFVHNPQGTTAFSFTLRLDTNLIDETSIYYPRAVALIGMANPRPFGSQNSFQQLSVKIKVETSSDESSWTTITQGAGGTQTHAFLDGESFFYDFLNAGAAQADIRKQYWRFTIQTALFNIGTFGLGSLLLCNTYTPPLGNVMTPMVEDIEIGTIDASRARGSSLLHEVGLSSRRYNGRMALTSADAAREVSDNMRGWDGRYTPYAALARDRSDSYVALVPPDHWVEDGVQGVPILGRFARVQNRKIHTDRHLVDFEFHEIAHDPH